jgi:ABC-type sugar transport system permease subunit
MQWTVFRSRWLPYVLVAPQMAVTVIFFFWPALKSLQLSLYQVSPFGATTTFIGLANFSKLPRDPASYDGVGNSFIFAGGVTVLAVLGALVLAGLAPQTLRGRALYRPPLLGPFGHIATPIRFSRDKPEPYRAPRMGEHGREDASEICGLDETRIDALETMGVFE